MKVRRGTPRGYPLSCLARLAQLGNREIGGAVEREDARLAHPHPICQLQDLGSVIAGNTHAAISVRKNQVTGTYTHIAHSDGGIEARQVKDAMTWHRPPCPHGQSNL